MTTSIYFCLYLQLPSEHQIGPNIFKAAIVMAGNKLQCDQNATAANKDEVIEQNEEIPDQPSQEEIRSRFTHDRCQ